MVKRYNLRPMIDGDNVMDWPRDLRHGPNVVLAPDLIATWSTNYGLDKRSPDEAMRWWSDNNIGQAPAGAVAALGLCLEAIARLTHERDALFGKLAEVLYHE